MTGFVARPIEQRFWEKVDQRGPDECWPWTGGRSTRGYGRVWADGRNQQAHRVAWELANGRRMPVELDACHTCDNPPCCNPAHIFPGTPSVNALDAKAKGRLVPPVSRFANQPACAAGHRYTPETTRWDHGARRCRICDAEKCRRYYARKRDRILAALATDEAVP